MERHQNILPSDKMTKDKLVSSNSSTTVSLLLGRISENNVSNNEWRRYGIERRRQLLEEDKASGGTDIELNNDCKIQGYFGLAEKVCFRKRAFQ